MFIHFGVLVAVLPVIPVICHRSQWILADRPQDLLSEVTPGDLLEFDRGTYRHWAVYVGTRHDLREHTAHHFDCPYCGGSLGAISFFRRLGGIFSKIFTSFLPNVCHCDRHFVVHRANPADSNILGVISRSQSASKGAFGIGHVIIEDLMDVWGTSPARKNNQFDYVRPDEAISAGEVLKRAFEQLVTKGAEILQDEYNVVLNNCEHFAVWVRYGKKDSAQVTRYALVVAIGLLLLGLKLLWGKRALIGPLVFGSGVALLVAVCIGRVEGVMHLFLPS